MATPLRAFVAMACALALAGCKSNRATNADASKPTAVATSNVPARPSAPPPPFKLFHQTDNSLTLVTDEHATDDQISAILWQLHDARPNGFASLGLPQDFIDHRDPMIWFHIYRGAKCASEKYTTGKLPCGPSYHAAGDYTLGGFTDKNHDDGILIHDENHETHLWPNP